MMGSGKSTVGRLLSKALGYYFFDTDELIEKLAGKSVSQIFAEVGEQEFRDMETEVLKASGGRRGRRRAGAMRGAQQRHRPGGSAPCPARALRSSRLTSVASCLRAAGCPCGERTGAT